MESIKIDLAKQMGELKIAREGKNTLRNYHYDYHEK